MTAGVVIRAPHAHEADMLSDMVLRSKASWGYPPDFMAACVDVLRITPEAIAEGAIRVAADAEADVPLGLNKVVCDGDGRAGLDKLFIAPEAMGSGVGALLFDDAAARAKALGATVMTIESDPGAESFYLRMGAIRVGSVASEAIPGRLLPKLEFKL
ncbi:GNAT family N-acetyltransferase [Rhodospirillaceae bacterium KN72]|uniref:GNAT family N-acetyltransferase n=1 Tax=Pacificispira spongiicola TaxID=2729598 RepID=A0A7Y0DZM4_9PROT|nr:GNAT family N-acetyltransferase [Pacificispira spongiicola]NMM44515.1 GNAT family N-acetyltransferase [Pacificispira spongiicola]